MEALLHIHVVTCVFLLLIMVTSSSVVLWYYLGLAGLFGIFISLFVLVLQLLLSILHNTLWKQSSSLADKRTTLVNDIIEGIKVLKYYNW